MKNTYAARVVNGRQIKGDPSVRASLFDTSIDRLHQIVLALLTRKGVFHTKIHYSSSQLTRWVARDPFCHEKFVREEVLQTASSAAFRMPTTRVAQR